MDKTCPMHEVRETIRYLNEGHARDKVVITASNSMRVKPPSSVLRSSSIRHKNQENTFLPFLLHVSFAAGPPPAPRTYSAIRTGPLASGNQNLVRGGSNPEALAEHGGGRPTPRRTHQVT